MLSVSHNFSLLWVHISEPGVYDIVSSCQHVATKWCLPRTLQQLQNYVLSRHACICPLTNDYQATSRVLPCLHMSTNQCLPFLRMSFNQCISNNIQKSQNPVEFWHVSNTHQTTSTKQSLQSDARTCWIKCFLMLLEKFFIKANWQMDFLVITGQLS